MSKRTERMTTVIRFPQLIKLIGLARSTVYVRIAEGTFPKPIKLGVRAIGWLESDIEEWIQSQVDESQSENKS